MTSPVRSWLYPTGGARVAALIVLTLLAAAFVYKEVFIDTPRAEAELASITSELLGYPAPAALELEPGAGTYALVLSWGVSVCSR